MPKNTSGAMATSPAFVGLRKKVKHDSFNRRGAVVPEPEAIG